MEISSSSSLSSPKSEAEFHRLIRALPGELVRGTWSLVGEEGGEDGVRIFVEPGEEGLGDEGLNDGDEGESLYEGILLGEGGVDDDRLGL